MWSRNSCSLVGKTGTEMDFDTHSSPSIQLSSIGTARASLWSPSALSSANAPFPPSMSPTASASRARAQISVADNIGLFSFHSVLDDNIGVLNSSTASVTYIWRVRQLVLISPPSSINTWSLRHRTYVNSLRFRRKVAAWTVACCRQRSKPAVLTTASFVACASSCSRPPLADAVAMQEFCSHGSGCPLPSE